jgi:hypothetical protein
VPTQAAAEAEVGDESVTQILGREIVQRCGCHETSSDRGNVVSLIMNCLHELGQRRPVTLSEESLVELTRQTVHRSCGRIWAAAIRVLTSFMPCSGLVAARRGSVFQSLTWASRVLADRRQRHVGAGADDAGAFIPEHGRTGGQNPRGLEPSLIWWQVGEPFGDELFP